MLCGVNLTWRHRLAVSGPNSHAEGELWAEEQDLIIPAIERLRQHGSV